MITIILFLIVIIVLVVIHELGHFFVAKYFGVRVDEFGIGYPPRARKLFVWKDTLFSLNWLPFGGFVKIFGEESDATNTVVESTSFVYQAKWKRVLIVLAGIVANILLAIVLYTASFSIGFLASPTDFPDSKILSRPELLVTDVMHSSPANKAGIVSGDIITEISSGTDTIKPTDTNAVITFVQSHGINPLTVNLLHNKVAVQKNITPSLGIVGGKPGIGVGLALVSSIRLPFLQALKTAVTYTFQDFANVFTGLGAMIQSAVHGGKGTLSQVSGPVGIAQITGQAFSLGFGAFLSFMALISINLAVINILPFPALDGGRFILELFATNGKSRIPKRIVDFVNQAGFVLLILLMLYVTYHDIVRLVT